MQYAEINLILLLERQHKASLDNNTDKNIPFLTTVLIGQMTTLIAVTDLG